MADDSTPNTPNSPETTDEAEGSRPDLRIVGASEAGQLVANLPGVRSGPDDDSDNFDEVDLDSADDADSGWMEAGDRTLAEVMGVVPDEEPDAEPSAPIRSALSIPFTPSLFGAADKSSTVQSDVSADDHADGDDVGGGDFAEPGFEPVEELEPPDPQDDETDDVDDDVFPEEMYAGTATARRASTDRRVAPRDSVSVAPIAAEETAAPARRKVVAPATSDDADGWSSFAGSGPRWRDEAKDWRDVDAEDPSAFGDDQTRIGALDPERSGAADLYVFEEGDPRRKSSAAARSSAVRSGAASSTGAKSDPGVIKIDATKRSELDAPSSGSQQRTSPGAARPGRQASKNAGEDAPKPGRAAGLGERIVTGVGLALIVGFIFYIGKNVGAAVVTGLAVLLAALELANALKRRAFRPAIPVIGVGVIAVVAAGMFRGERGVLVAMVLTVMSTLLWFLFGVERERPTVNIAATLLAFVYPGIAAACAALLLDTKHGTGLLIAAVACTVGHDVFAYFCGRFLGRTKLAPEISPNKTVEGLIGGMIGSVLIGGVLLGKVGWYPWQSVTHGLFVGFAVALAAPVGDLIESQLKRDLDIKDMGSMLPGHGGVLDRIDGMLLAVPAVWLVAVALRLI